MTKAAFDQELSPLSAIFKTTNRVIDFLIPSQVNLASFKNPYGLLFFISVPLIHPSRGGLLKSGKETS